MDKNGEQPKENNVSSNHAKKLPAEIVGRVLQKLTVKDRLRSERVSPLWERALSRWGWIEQTKMDSDIVFEGVQGRAISHDFARFWENLEDGSCNLVSLLRRCSPWIQKLNLTSLVFAWSFGEDKSFVRFLSHLPQIVELLHLMKNLEKLDIRRLDIDDFMDHLPQTLRKLKISEIRGKSLQTLSIRCPDLEEVPFKDVYKNKLKTQTVIKLIRKFPRQKRLDLLYYTLRSSKVGALESIGQLKELVELNLQKCLSLDGASLKAIAEGCQRLRSLSFNLHQLTELELLQLAKLPNLSALRIFYSNVEFSDAVLKAIAQRGQLKRLQVLGHYDSEAGALTDDSVVYLVERCKSLVSLHLDWCRQITERSLKAVIAEVKRRHGMPPRALPTGYFDNGIFYFYASGSEINWRRAEELIGDNPWLRHKCENRKTKQFLIN